jgi:hypothetical protein
MALFTVGAPGTRTVTTVELAIDVTSPEAVSVALMVAVLPGNALAATVTTPVALMPATLGAED